MLDLSPREAPPLPATAPRPAESARPRPRRAAAWRVARGGLIAYLVVLLMISWNQSSLIFPGRSSRGLPEYRVDPGPGVELVRLTTADGDRIAALFGPALDPAGRPRPDASGRPTLLYFYGNASSLRGSLGLFESFRRLGVNVMVPEYVGFGMSEGEAGESGCYATAEAAYRHLAARPDVDPRRIVPAGWSLGGAVAIDLASRREVAGLAVFGTFTSMAEMAGRRYPWLPTRWLLRHHFESERKIGRVAAPAFLAHGLLDPLIPPSMSDRLAAAASGPATRFDVPDAGHNDLFDPGRPALFGALGRFLDGLP